MSGWLREERSDIAATRILDVAAELFVARGVSAVGMADVARAAGCSRATLYRYFDSRRALHLAFVHREARRIGSTIVREIDGGEPETMVVEAVLTAVRLVRADPTLSAWFHIGDAGIAGEIAQSSAVIESLGSAFLKQAGMGAAAGSLEARWLVRVIVSLLTVPGRDSAEERAMVERFVAPMVRDVTGPR